MTSMWEDTFRSRMERFGSRYSASPDDIPVSIKIRVWSHFQEVSLTLFQQLSKRDLKV